MTNTALGAVEIEEEVRFNGEEHESFYYTMLFQCESQDVYHQALVYCLGISPDTRRHFSSLYNLRTGSIKTEGMTEGWVSGTDAKAIRMAFDLYCDRPVSIYDYDDSEEALSECRNYAADNIFCCSYAPYFWEAIKLRYPDYCEEVAPYV